MSDDRDLGFAFRKTRDGYTIVHRGKTAATLRGVDAEKFASAMAGADFAERQRRMAKLTGNYKRGNERSARNHPRNRT